jgi:hypothetical protein
MASARAKPKAPEVPPAERVWSLLARPVNGQRAVESLLGLTPIAAHLMASVVLASSPEVDDLIDAVPTIFRSMSIATTARNQRLHGEVRGPIVWSETVSARGASAGDPMVYVCSSPRRAYDTAENRVLAAALRQVITAASLVDRQGLRRRDTELARHIRFNAGLAVRYADHRTIEDVSRPPDRRDVARTRAGKRRQVYSPALAVLDRATSPVDAGHVMALSDPRTAAQHALVADTVELLGQRGQRVPPLRAADGVLAGGPVTYVHDGSARRSPLAAGVHVGDLLLDVPVAADGTVRPGPEVLAELQSRAGGTAAACAVVVRPADLARALDQVEHGGR